MFLANFDDFFLPKRGHVIHTGPSAAASGIETLITVKNEAKHSLIVELFLTNLLAFCFEISLFAEI
jgi:hypothetical protein